MDKIQKILIQAGRKDLAQEYYKKVAGFRGPEMKKFFEKYLSYFLEIDYDNPKSSSNRSSIGILKQKFQEWQKGNMIPAAATLSDAFESFANDSRGKSVGAMRIAV